MILVKNVMQTIIQTAKVVMTISFLIKKRQTNKFRSGKSQFMIVLQWSHLSSIKTHAWIQWQSMITTKNSFQHQTLSNRVLMSKTFVNTTKTTHGTNTSKHLMMNLRYCSIIFLRLPMLSIKLNINFSLCKMTKS